MQEYHKHQFLTHCPICLKDYDQHWKVVNHIRKSKEDKHQSFLRIQEEQYIAVYDSSDRKKFYDELAKKKNIFAGTSFAHSSKILRNKYSAKELEKTRKHRISKTMRNVPKSKEHNENVSKSVKEAWARGLFDTKEVKAARKKGYANRVSFAGKNNPMYGKPCPKRAGKGKGGYREDIGHYVRSRWEANVCRICNYVGREYKYEPIRFSVDIDGVDYTYCPDLYFPNKNSYYEIKGHARSSANWICECKSCVKNKKLLDAVREKYKIKLLVIGRDEYNRLKRRFVNRIEKWET